MPANLEKHILTNAANIVCKLNIGLVVSLHYCVNKLQVKVNLLGEVVVGAAVVVATNNRFAT